MGYQLKFIRERNFVLSLLEDRFNEAELMEGIGRLTQEVGDMHPFVELADTTRLRDLSGLSKNGVAFAGAMEYARTPYKRDKLAILVASDEAFELAAMYAATSGYYRYDAKIFRDFMAAVSWLGLADLAEQIDEMRKIG